MSSLPFYGSCESDRARSSLPNGPTRLFVAEGWRADRENHLSCNLFGMLFEWITDTAFDNAELGPGRPMGAKLAGLKKKMSSRSQLRYPPGLSEERLFGLIDEVKDWQLNHGSLIKLVRTEEDHTIQSRPIGVSLFPTPFPKPCFDEARELQTIYNELYTAVAADEEWLEETLQDLLRFDRFTAVLWEIHLRVKRDGYAQDLSLGIFRSDYMLFNPYSPRRSPENLSIKQVEFNAYSCAGGTHGNRISNMHRHLSKTGANTPNVPSYPLPTCGTVEGIIAGLSAAHKAYLPPKTKTGRTGVLMVVQPFNVNVCDERPIEYALWGQDPPIPVYRVIYGAEVLRRTKLNDDTRVLLFKQPNGEDMEVSVVYHRAGYDEAEYYEEGINARIRMEKSLAIKCPSVLSHITGFKKVQQALGAPGALARFLPPEKVARIEATFAPLYPMDESEQGQYARKLALDPAAAVDYVLKPSLEGGGHNVFGAAIPDFLKGTPPEMWSNYILMKMIIPPVLTNILMSPRELYSGSVRSELGIFGVCLWRQSYARSEDSESQPRRKMEFNRQVGFSFKTKSVHVNEMSVIKGYGCFDTPLLVDFDTFGRIALDP